MSDTSRTLGEGIACLLLTLSLSVRTQADLQYLRGVLATTGFWIPPKERPGVIAGLLAVKCTMHGSHLIGSDDLVLECGVRIDVILAMEYEPPVSKGEDETPPKAALRPEPDNNDGFRERDYGAFHR
jgi:hypothetical protein